MAYQAIAGQNKPQPNWWRKFHKPGFFHLGLSLFHIEQSNTHARISKYANDFSSEDTSVYNMHALTNLKGLVFYSLNQMRDAVTCFEEVLRDDACNLNALANVSMVYGRLGRTRDAEECKGRVSNFLRVGGERAEEAATAAVARARCLAEQGYALTVCVEDELTEESYRRSIALYRDALIGAETLDGPPKIHNDELAEWYSCMSYNYQKINDNDFDKGEVQEGNFSQCIDAVFKVLSLAESKDLLANAWTSLGTALIKRPQNYRCPDQFPTAPEECLEKALELSSSIKIKCKVANAYTYMKRLQEAHDLLNEDEEHENHWLSLARLAKINRDMYRRNRAENGALLEVAREKMERSLALRRTVKNLCYLGRILFLQAMHDKEFSDGTECKALLEESIFWFSDTLHFLDGDRNPYVHEYLGDSLANYGELRLAVESYKTAVGVNTKPNNVYWFNKLMDQLCELHRKERETQIIGELAYWIDFGCKTYKSASMAGPVGDRYKRNRSLMKNVFVKMRELHFHDSLEMCYELLEIHERGHQGRPPSLMLSQGWSNDVLQDLRRCMNQARNNLGKTFDFFVSYCPQDVCWVVYSLMLKLETSFGVKGYIVGRPRDADSVTNGITNSVCTVMVLSTGYLENTWPEGDLEATLNQEVRKGHKIIVVKQKECAIPQSLIPIVHLDTAWERDWARVQENIERFCLQGCFQDQVEN